MPKLVNPGWRPSSWAENLERMAAICIHPDRAIELKQWADQVRKAVAAGRPESEIMELEKT